MTTIETQDNKVKFLKLTVFAIGLAFFICYVTTIANEEFYIMLKKHLSFYLLSSFIYLYIGLLLSNIKYQFTTMYRFIIVSIYFHTYLFCLIHCNISNIVFLHFIPICVAALMIFKYKIVIIFSIVSIGITIVSKNINAYFYKNTINYFNETTIQKFEIITIIYTIVFLIYILYYYIKFKEKPKELNTTLPSEAVLLVEQITPLKQDDNTNKFEVLYKEIINYFENEKPYTNSEFNIIEIAKALNTNTSYISKSLNSVGKIKFNSLVNLYRINQIIVEFEKRRYKFETIEAIFTRVGFTQQSTFNRVFKEQTGITPTEYIDKKESQNN